MVLNQQTEVHSNGKASLCSFWKHDTLIPEKAPICGQTSLNSPIHVQWADSTTPSSLHIIQDKRRRLLARCECLT